ncbi:CUE domain-containing protein [Gossypium australe]|uniref:CUE domain-containing protein n=1 Tax=Gossypium australe TaxID=47621 RepID=A0A5B6UCV0_9ROSI|nr:CUE domain-containing protein [Gossypium australe]
MSAGVCGKRVGFEEIFGSSPKRFRCSGYESPNSSSDPGSRPDDRVSTFSALDPEVHFIFFLTSVVDTNEDFKESSNALSSDLEERNKQYGFDCVRTGNCTDETATCSQISDYNVEDVNKQKFYDRNAVNSPEWTDLFVHEMTSAMNMDDAKARTARILEAFERRVVANKRAAEEIEHASLKEHLRSLLDNNQILRRAVAIQHERNIEQEGKEREVQHLKLTLNQYIEQARTLEVCFFSTSASNKCQHTLNNYTLRLHLQRAQAQQSSSIKGQFPPDIY